MAFLAILLALVLVKAFWMGIWGTNQSVGCWAVSPFLRKAKTASVAVRIVEALTSPEPAQTRNSRIPNISQRNNPTLGAIYLSATRR